MIDPIAIIELKSENEVSTKDGVEEDVSRIAVWDWSQTGRRVSEELLRCHTNSGKMYVKTEFVDEIISLRDGE